MKNKCAPFALSTKNMISKPRHNERCKECKKRVKELLLAEFGNVIVNHNLNISNKLGDFRDTPHYDALGQIFESLRQHRGHMTFVLAKKLPNVDFFVPSPGFIFEFDESQHFTAPRELSLDHYPDQLELGFHREKWMHLCRRLHMKDNDPPYRDEQRAWYDTLRDFAPSILGLAPTIRVYARDVIWCSLDPDSQEDRKKFQQIIGVTCDVI